MTLSFIDLTLEDVDINLEVTISPPYTFSKDHITVFTPVSQVNRDCCIFQFLKSLHSSFDAQEKSSFI